MRVGANARQHARIRKLHKNGFSAQQILTEINITPQSMEKIIAHIEDREENILELDNNPQVQALRKDNAELAARLATFEDPQPEELTVHLEDEDGDGSEEESEEEAEAET